MFRSAQLVLLLNASTLFNRAYGPNSGILAFLNYSFANVCCFLWILSTLRDRLRWPSSGTLRPSQNFLPHPNENCSPIPDSLPTFALGMFAVLRL
jgi:hypothetical protein